MNGFYSGRKEKLFNEQFLAEISHGLTEQEEKRCRNAINEVIYALKFCGFESRKNPSSKYSNQQEYKRMIYSPLQDNNNIQIAVFLQGSYASNTNVKGRSDVDIVVMDLSKFRAHYRPDQSNKDYGFTNATNNINIKDIIIKGFIEYFGKELVERHDKCINIKATRDWNKIDIVPTMQYRDYTKDYSRNKENYVEGTLIKTDKGEEIINFPFHHINNSEQKHYNTQRRYRKLVRIMKYLMYDMQKENIAEAKDVSSFGVESLIFNINNNYLSDTYKPLGIHFQEVLDILRQMLSNNYHNWVEANGIQPLFKNYILPSDDEKQKYISFISKLKYYFRYFG